VYVGNKYLTIHLNLPFGEEAPPPEPVLKVENLEEPLPEAVIWSSDEPEVPVKTIEQTQTKPDLETVRLRFATHLTKQNAQMLDSKSFTDPAQCDGAVRQVVDEYRKRGVREQDSAETAPFGGSSGLVWILQNGGKLHYIGCLVRPEFDGAVYVHFVPNALGAAPVTP
jgi:hypothetical protein